MDETAHHEYVINYWDYDGVDCVRSRGEMHHRLPMNNRKAKVERSTLDDAHS